MQAVYYDPYDPAAGVIARGFQSAARRRSPGERRAVSAAADVWHTAAASARSAPEIAAIALASADMYGVGDVVLAGLHDAGVGQAVEEAATDSGVVALAKKAAGKAEQAAYALGRGVKDVALAPSRTIQKIAEEGGKTARETVRQPGDVVKKGLETVQEGSKGFFEALTTGQMIGGAIVGVGLIALIMKKA